MAVAGEVKVTAGAGATLLRVSGRPRLFEARDGAAVLLDMREIDEDAELEGSRSPATRAWLERPGLRMSR
jgi:hypothetical protein